MNYIKAILTSKVVQSIAMAVIRFVVDKAKHSLTPEQIAEATKL